MNYSSNIPEHIAIIMDGNGRWATQRNRPRSMGHQAGLKALRKVVEHCGRIGVQVVTVFAFSSENWNRPKKEVSRLMDLFLRALDKEARELHDRGVRLCFYRGYSRFFAAVAGKNCQRHAANCRQYPNDSECGR